MAIVREIVNPNGKPRLLNPDGFPDNGGNRFTARVINVDGTGPGTQIVVTKITLAGVRTDIDSRPATNVDGYPAAKWDNCCCFQVNDSVLVIGVAHLGDRRSQEEEYTIPGVCVPYPNGHAPMGGEAFVPGDNPPPTPTPTFTVADIVNAIKAEFGGDIRRGLEDKVTDGLLYMFDPANYDPTGHDPNKVKSTRFQLAQYTKFLEDIYFALNKQITGENIRLPVANQGFIDLITRIVHGTQPQALQQGVMTADDQEHITKSGPMGATTENLAGDGERSYTAAAEPDKGDT